MTQPTPCPPRADFEAMLLGRMDDERSAALEEHIENCADCQRVVDGLMGHSPLTDALRSGAVPVTAAVPEPGIEVMISRLEDMARQFTPSGFDLSASAEGTPFDPMQPVETLARMGSYRILQLLGAGGMGLVYLAEDEVLHRRVAVKVLRPRLAQVKRAREGFLREARAMAALKHDNLVTVFQVGEADGTAGTVVPFLAMELLEGESLAEWLRREGPILPAWAARIGMQGAEALAIAHARGIVHRDIKPGNLWLEAPHAWSEAAPERRPPLPSVARVKVLDFGLAQPPGEDSLEDGKHVFGTPAYMSPEQGAGKEVDHRADLFSLGVVLYELITGRQPFLRESRNAAMTYPAPVPIQEVVPSISPDLAALIHRLLAPDPAARPASTREVSLELAAFVLPSTDATLPIAPEMTTKVSPQKRRSRVAALAVFTALIIAGGVWLATRRDNQEPQPSVPPPPTPEWFTQPGPPDDAWVEKVAALSVEQQSTAVRAKLRELNPGFDGRAARVGVEEGKLTELTIYTDRMSDIRPLRALRGLKQLSVIGSAVGKGRLTDLSPIRGLPLTVLNVWQNPELSDVSAARGMKLTLFQAGDTAIEDLSPLEGMPIGILAVNGCRVKDVTPVQTMPKIRYLRCDGCPIETLAPLIKSSLKELVFDYSSKRDDASVLERLTGLERINGLPAKEFRRRLSQPR